MIDSGATCSVVPATLLVELGIEPTSEQRFTIPNGQIITRRRGNALFFYQGGDGASPVVFGEEGDSILLGAVTLEALGCSLPCRNWTCQSASASGTPNGSSSASRHHTAEPWWKGIFAISRGLQPDGVQPVTDADGP